MPDPNASAAGLGPFLDSANPRFVPISQPFARINIELPTCFVFVFRPDKHHNGQSSFPGSWI